MPRLHLPPLDPINQDIRLSPDRQRNGPPIPVHPAITVLVPMPIPIHIDPDLSIPIEHPLAILLDIHIPSAQQPRCPPPHVRNRVAVLQTNVPWISTVQFRGSVVFMARRW